MKYIIIFGKFLIDNIIYYMIFNKESISGQSKKLTFKSTAKFSFISILLLISSYLLILNTSILRIMSAIIFTAYLSIEAKNKNKFHLILTYSCFCNFIMEAMHFIIYKLVYVTSYNVGVFDKISDYFAWNLISIIYSVILFAIYKFDLMKIEYFRIISKYKFASMISIILLICISGFKNFYKNIESIEHCLAISTSILIAVVLLMIIAIIIIKNIENNNKKHNSKIGDKISKNICDKLDLSTDMYKVQSQLIAKKLKKLGMHSGLAGFSLIESSVLIIMNLSDKRVNLRRDVYPIISENTGINIETIDKNIKTCICTALNSFDYELFIKEYGKPLSKNKTEPSVKEFLLTVSNNITTNNTKN